jgi:cell division protein FtsI (penicillin-binding protein 3)
MAISTDKYRITAAPRNIQSFVPINCTDKTKNYCHSVDGKPVNARGAVAVARIISPLLKLNPLELGAKLNGDGLYVEVKKDVSIETKRKIDKLNLAGYIFSEIEPDRAYPNGNVAGNIIGAVSTDNKGSAGIEQMEEKALSGTPGKYSYEIGAEGQEIPQTNSQIVEPIPGKTVQSTIDLDVQWKVQQALDEGANAEYGIAVVEDVKTGEILALADTNSPDAGTPEVALNPSRAVTDVFEPGSTAKVITCSELIDLGLQTPFSQFQVPYSWTTGGQTFSDAEEHGVENLTLTGVLAHSSNVGTVMASSALTNEQKWNYLSRFGVGKLTGIGLPGESAGLMAPWQSWDGRTQYTVLFGQGLATNAIQATNVFAAIANKGKKLTPTIIKGVIDSNGKVSENTRPAPEQVIKKETSEQVMKMMEAAITNGNIYGVNVPGYRVAGKTGTAQMANSTGKLTDIMASFIGVFPADNPKYVVSVFYKNPQGAYFGALVAGPVATKIMNFLVSHESITPSKPIEDPFPTEW